MMRRGLAVPLAVVFVYVLFHSAGAEQASPLYNRSQQAAPPAVQKPVQPAQQLQKPKQVVPGEIRRANENMVPMVQQNKPVLPPDLRCTISGAQSALAGSPVAPFSVTVMNKGLGNASASKAQFACWVNANCFDTNCSSCSDVRQTVSPQIMGRPAGDGMTTYSREWSVPALKPGESKTFVFAAVPDANGPAKWKQGKYLFICHPDSGHADGKGMSDWANFEVTVTGQ